MAVATVSIVFLFQNCGSPQAELNPEEISEFSEGEFDSEIPVDAQDPNKTAFINNYQTTALENDNVSLSAPDSVYSTFSDGLCQWTFTSTTNVISTLNNPSRTLALTSIKKAQEGTYQLHCENSTKEHTFIFKVYVQTSSTTNGGSTTGATNGTTTGGGTTATPEVKAVGYIYYKGSLKGQTSSAVIRSVALSECKNAIATKGKGRGGFTCKWNGSVIYSN